MRIYLFAAFLAAVFAYGLVTADIEPSKDKDDDRNATLAQPNKELNGTDVGDVDLDSNDKDEETNSTTLSHASTSRNNTDDEEEEEKNANVTTSAIEKNETHNEAEKTAKRHAVYETYYISSGTPQAVGANFVEYNHDRGYADTIPGVQGKDYPIFSEVPPTSFTCEGKAIGLYGDVEARCQVWHNCQPDGRKDSFLCPNGTLFRQEVLVCDWWHNVDCASTPSFYGVSARLIQHGSSGSHHAYTQQVNRYQNAQGTTGYYYNYQNPFYVKTTTYPSGYYFDTGFGANSATLSQAQNAYASSAAAGSSFVSNSNQQGGYSAGYYYRPTYQSPLGGTTSGGYGYTVSTRTPGHVTARYDAPSSAYYSGSSGSSGSASSGAFNYAFSSGQLPASFQVPTITGSLSQAQRVGYTQRITNAGSSGDRPDHPNYNEKSGYNYRPPQAIPVRVSVPQTQYRVLNTADVRQKVEVVQPKISIPIQPIRVTTPVPVTYDNVIHPNANEKSGYTSQQTSVRSQQNVQQANYAFSTYNSAQQSQLPVIRPVPTPAPAVVVAPTPAAPHTVVLTPTINQQQQYQQRTRQQYTAEEMERIHPNYNEKSGYNYRPPTGPIPRPTANGAQTVSYQFSTYNAGNQYPAIQQQQQQHTASQIRQYSSGSQSAGFSYSSYNNAADSVHPNANEKSGYTQQRVSAPIQTNYQFSTYNQAKIPAIKTKQVTVAPLRVAARVQQVSTYEDHPNANEKSGYVPRPVPVPIPSPVPIPVPITTPTPRRVSVNLNTIDHPNANEKSGYNPRPYIGAPIVPRYPAVTTLAPPRVQVDCEGLTTCLPQTQPVYVVPDDSDSYHVNFGQRIESNSVRLGSGSSSSGSMAASDRNAGAGPNADGYY